MEEECEYEAGECDSNTFCFVLRNMIYLSMLNGCAPIVAVEDGTVSPDFMYNYKAG